MSIIGNIERSYEYMQMMLGGTIFREQASNPLAGQANANPHLYASSADDKLHFVDANGIDAPVSTAAAGPGWDPVRLASVAAIVGTYSSTTQKLTVTATGLLTVDGENVAVGDRIGLKTQGTQTQNGLYDVTVAGATGVNAVLTRASDANASGMFIDGKTFAVGEGTLAGTVWVFTTNAPFTLDTSNVVFARETNVMHIDDAQTITALKKFETLMLAVWNSAKTFVTTFSTKATVARTVALPDISGDINVSSYATVQTTDASATIIDTIAIPTGKMVLLESKVDAIKGDYTQGASYIVRSAFRNNAGTVSQVLATEVDAHWEDDATWGTPTHVISSTNVLVKVTGKVGTTINHDSYTNRF